MPYHNNRNRQTRGRGARNQTRSAGRRRPSTSGYRPPHPTMPPMARGSQQRNFGNRNTTNMAPGRFNSNGFRSQNGGGNNQVRFGGRRQEVMGNGPGTGWPPTTFGGGECPPQCPGNCHPITGQCPGGPQSSAY